MIRIRNLAATVGVAAALSLTAAPAFAEDCVGDAAGSAAGQPTDEECGEVLDDSLEKPKQAAPEVESEALAQTGVSSGAMLIAAGSAFALGGGAVVASRRRSQS